MKRRQPAAGPRLEVDDVGEPNLEQDAPDVGQPADEEEQPVEGEVLEPAWDVDSVEKTLMGLWNFQVLYYGIDYAAELGECRKAAEQLLPVFEEYVPPQMQGVIGGVAGAGLIAGTGVAMWQKEKRVRARRWPQGPLAAMLGRRRPRPAGASEPAEAAAQAPPAGPTPAQPVQPAQGGADEPKRVFTAEEEAAIRAHQGGPGDNPLEAFGIPGY